jgi:hypothetical protein
MDADAKKTTLRMIPYGIYMVTADVGKGAGILWRARGGPARLADALRVSRGPSAPRLGGRSA